ncbi:MAG: hypothetical protein RR923_05455, partial [Bacilli bacterium]
NNIILLIITFYFIPILTLYSYGSVDNIFFIYSNIYIGMLVLAQMLTPLFYIENSVLKYKKEINLYNLLILISVLFSIYLNIKYTGFRVVTDLFNVYNIREEASKYPMNLIERYAFNLLPIILSVLANYTLKYKKIFLLILIIIAEWLLFSIAGQKMIFFLTILNIIFYVIYNKNILKIILAVTTFIPLLGYLEYSINKITWIIAIIYDRTIFGIPHLSYYYYKFFKENPINFFRDGIVGKFKVESIYSNELGKIIAESMQKIQFNNANNGLIGNAVSGLGIVGIFLLPIVIVVSLRMLDFVTYNKPPKILYGSCVYFYSYYSNGSFSEALVGGGLLILVLLYYFFPIKKEKR